jgi:hypothetical protein
MIQNDFNKNLWHFDPKMDCSICLDKIILNNTCTTDCGHVFHLTCMLKMCTSMCSCSGVKCPMCRNKLISGQDSDSSNDDSNDDSDSSNDDSNDDSDSSNDDSDSSNDDSNDDSDSLVIYHETQRYDVDTE